MKHKTSFSAMAALSAALLGACAAGSNDDEAPAATGETGPGGDGGQGGATTGTATGGDLTTVGPGSGGSGAGTPIPGTTCDDGIALDDEDPMNGARAIELCDAATSNDASPGVIEAKYVRADGSPAASPLQYGILESFGPNVLPQAGKRMLVLSSGHARAAGQPDACGHIMCSNLVGEGTPPPGFPQTVPDCDSDFTSEYANKIYDDVGLELQLRAPVEAEGYRVAYRLYSFEYPEFVCSPYNDQFVMLVDPPPQGAVDGNVAFDDDGNPIGVNMSYFQICDPAGIMRFASKCPPSINNCPAPPNPYCPEGPAELAGTGFDGTWSAAPWIGDEDGGATVWLTSSAPVTGGDELTIRFAIWDKGDTAYDATILIDRFEWLTGDVGVETDPIEPPL
jgi:hypothetical protein